MKYVIKVKVSYNSLRFEFDSALEALEFMEIFVAKCESDPDTTIDIKLVIE